MSAPGLTRPRVPQAAAGAVRADWAPTARSGEWRLCARPLGAPPVGRYTRDTGPGAPGAADGRAPGSADDLMTCFSGWILPLWKEW